MADVVGVVFRNGTKTYHFDPMGLELSKGDRVVVETMQGTEIGQVVEPPHEVDDSELSAPLKKVVRVATGEDLQAQAEAESVRRDAMITCRELIRSHGLDMKLVDAEVSFGGEKITFSFYSDERVDFRSLVSDLARTLKRRIELRQIGAREEARMVGGLGPCGRHLCCNLFPGDEEPVSIRMAKEQNLPLNPMKISGLCGRLMCCLKYEQDQYVTFRKEAPSKGTPVKWGDAEGNIIGYNVLKDAIVVRFEDGSISDVKLGGCEADEHGCLNCVREVEEPKVLPIPEITYGGRTSASDEGDREKARENGEGASSGADADSKKGDGEGKTGGKSRSRRSRSRRGKGKTSDGAAADGGASGAGADASSDAADGGGSRTSGRSRRRKPAQKSGQPGDASADRSGEGKPAGEGDGGANGEGSAKRPRRRRRPRRRSSGSGGNGGDGGGSEGNSAGS